MVLYSDHKSLIIMMTIIVRTRVTVDGLDGGHEAGFGFVMLGIRTNFGTP